MKVFKMRSLILLGALVACVTVQSTAMAQRPFSRVLGMSMATKGDVWAQEAAAGQPWHGQYSYTTYGQPTALVVPPTAMMQQNYSWGVSQNTMTPIYHQYGYSAVPSAGGAFYATPRWPSNTNQFGVYPVRAPW
jgi:hypothetical protein